MACNCNAKYDNKVPCCCSTGEPVICTTTTCPDAQPCNVIVETDCVVYDGPTYDCAGIENSMILTEVIDIILAATNLIDCTTTTTTIPSCRCYTVDNLETIDGVVAYKIDYFDCENIFTSVLVPKQTSVNVCALQNTIIPNFTYDITDNGSCDSNCTTTTTII